MGGYLSVTAPPEVPGQAPSHHTAHHHTPRIEGAVLEQQDMGKFLQQGVSAALTLVSVVFAEDPSGREQCAATAESSSSCDVVGAPEVPVIDISPLMRSDEHSAEEWDTASEAVARACKEWGFFQVCCWCGWGGVGWVFDVGLSEKCGDYRTHPLHLVTTTGGPTKLNLC